MLYFNINLKKILINISQPNYCYNFTTITVTLQLLCYFVQACVGQVFIKWTCVIVCVSTEWSFEWRS